MMTSRQDKLVDQSFPRGQRIRSQKEIDALFASPKVFFRYPFKVVINDGSNGKHPLRLLVSVPKRIIRKAVVRNKIKRLIREAWRKNKAHLELHLTESQRCFDVALIYNAKSVLPYIEIEDKIIQIFQRLIQVNEES
jgi:ribonuclease P protein component